MSVIQFRSKTAKKFKFTVTLSDGEIITVFANSYAEMIKDPRINCIKKTVRIRA